MSRFFLSLLSFFSVAIVIGFPMQKYKELFDIIASYPRILIYGHSLPDGDCYGCQIGLRNVLRKAFPKKEIYAIGTGIPQFAAYFGEMDVVPADKIPGSLGVLVDVSCLRRVEKESVNRCAAWIKFDHHTPHDNEPFPYPMALEPERVSCAEVVVDFCLDNKLYIPPSAAAAFYLGILTDSGHFAFHGTTHHTLYLASVLIKQGIDPKKVIEYAFYQPPEVRRYIAYLKKQAQFDNGVTYAYMKPSDWDAFGISFKQAGDLVNCLAGMNRCKVYCLFTEDKNGVVRVELRSNQNYEVQPIAASFGGGGHRFAAGIDYDKAEDCPTQAIIDACASASLYNEKTEE